MHILLKLTVVKVSWPSEICRCHGSALGGTLGGEPPYPRIGWQMYFKS